jgi:hypothetical protein
MSIHTPTNETGIPETNQESPDASGEGINETQHTQPEEAVDAICVNCGKRMNDVTQKYCGSPHCDEVATGFCSRL